MNEVASLSVHAVAFPQEEEGLGAIDGRVGPQFLHPVCELAPLAVVAEALFGVVATEGVLHLVG